MATTIQNIELPKKPRARDTSGNNNHGEIYSGRGLEFDGVTDYLNAGVAFSETNHTVAFWAMSNDNDDSSFFADTRDVNEDGLFIGFNANNIIQARVNDAATLTSTSSYTNTWVRVVHTYDGTTQKIYINGVLDVSQSVTETLNTTRSLIIGRKNYGAANWFDGYLSDGQFWDAAWTQTDVTYDYLNPESLALNASGSALTEGNLKLWYPMQDGHRGQQSYILDGANTGLGEEMVFNGDFSDGDTGWVKAATTSATQELTADGLRMYSGTAGDNSNRMSDTASTMSGKEGVYYVLKLTATDFVGLTTGSIRLDGVYDSDNLIQFTEATTEVVFKAYRDFTHFQFYAGGHSDYYTVNNVSLKPINDKHHATTVFYGDELVINGTFATSDLSDFSTTYATHAIVSEELKTTLNTANGYGFSKVSFTAVVGRSYRIQVDAQQGTADTTQVKQQAGITLTSSSATAGSWSFDGVGVATATTCVVRLQAWGANADYAIFDNVSVKEVGVASGWTDADQQLHIPQTALQSYNELAWFGGFVNCEVALGSAINTASNSWSLSFWLYEQENNYTYSWPIGQGTQSNILTKNSSSRRLHYRDSSGGYHPLAPVDLAPLGQWNHFVIAATGDTKIQAYVNGAKQAENSDMTATLLLVDNFMNGYGSGNHFVVGSITEVAYYNTVLTDANALDLFNDGKAKSALEASGSGGLVGYWRNNGLSTWTDLKGSNNGTPNAVVTETILIPEGVDATRDSQGFLMNRARSTSSLNFPSRPQSSTEVPDFGDLDFGTGDFSMECWVQYGFINNSTFGAGTSGLNVMLSTGSASSSNSEGISLLSTSTDFKFRIGDGDKEDSLDIDPDPLTVGNWYHIVVTREGTALIAYVDGDANNNMTITSGINVSRSEPLRIGDDRLESRTYKWPIDAVKFYNAALSASEVLQNYNATKRDHAN